MLGLCFYDRVKNRGSRLGPFRSAALLALGCFSCGGNNAKNYQAAGATAGFGVLAAGVNRGITGDCWANCPPGTRCDRARGVCEDLPCRGECPVGKRCERFGDRYECVVSGFMDRPLARDPATSADAGAADAADDR
jgi:hypothetical protein